jgi:hypothetical protein
VLGVQSVAEQQWAVAHDPGVPLLLGHSRDECGGNRLCGHLLKVLFYKSNENIKNWNFF